MSKDGCDRCSGKRVQAFHEAWVESHKSAAIGLGPPMKPGSSSTIVATQSQLTSVR